MGAANRIQRGLQWHDAGSMKEKNPPKAAPTADIPKVGRPKTGKRSNPDYTQVSAWVRRDTYRRVMDRLYIKEDRREFSDLIQTLMENWLKGKR